MAKARERVLVPSPLGAGSGTLIASPFQFAVSGEDNLRLRVWFINFTGAGAFPNCVALAFRSVAADGTIHVTTRTVTPTDDRVKAEFPFALAPGFVQDLTVSFVQSSTFAGLCYVTVDLIRGLPPGATTLVGQLLGGYIRPGKSLAWPGSPITGSTDDVGYPRIVECPLLTVGSDVQITQPSLTRWRVRAVHAVLLTSAVVANRLPQVVLNNGGALDILRLPSAAVVAGGGAGACSWLAGGGALAPPTGINAIAPWPDGLVTVGVNFYKTSTIALDVGDQYREFRVFVEEWLEANV